MRIALIVPTNRPQQIVEFLDAWQHQLIESNTAVYVVEDGPRRTFELGLSQRPNLNVSHLSWRDAPKGMLDCITVKSPGCRQIGFWKAFHDSCEVLVTLDDDVRPSGDSNIFLHFYDLLTNGVPLWVDPLLNYRSRGYPVENVGVVPTAFHVGSFLTVPDVDGETQLAHESEFDANPPRYLPRVTILPKRQLMPVNGGIAGWGRGMTPYVHYSVWSEQLAYRRFDDIWMGIVVKRLLDYTGLNMSYGPPFVNHIRASDARTNAKKEAAGKKWNERFWELLDERLEQEFGVQACSLRSAYERIASSLGKIDNHWARAEGAAMLKWTGFFDA